MTLFNKKLLVTTVASAALFVSASAFAAGCPQGEVCGLDLDINNNTSKTIDGLGSVDLSGINIEGAGEIGVNVPNPVNNAFEFSQTNAGNVNSTLNYYGEWISGNFVSKTSAIANNASITTNGSAALESVQDNGGDVNAVSNITMTHLVSIKGVDVSVTGVGNNASFDTTGDLVVDSLQNNQGNISAYSNLNLYGQAALTTADVNVEVAAIGNNFSGKHDGSLIGSVIQANCGDVNAVADVNVYGMKDPVNVTAVGNNISISRK